MSVGLAPTPGPRGLIRIYTPYLNQSDLRIMNFIAIEPIVNGDRGLSELEHSFSDGHTGKRLWTADTVDLQHPPAYTSTPAPGVVTRVGDHETLSFFVIVDPFKNGAKPIVQITFRSDRPHEVSLATFTAVDSAPLESCVLTATMGNWARLRHLHLKDRVVDASTLFQNDTINDWGFFRWYDWGSSELSRDATGDITVSATADADKDTPDTVPLFWRYEGMPAVQTWRTADLPGVKARVNGRQTFWASKIPVPGGPAFENFELLSPYQSGQVFTFRVTPENAH